MTELCRLSVVDDISVVEFGRPATTAGPVSGAAEPEPTCWPEMDAVPRGPMATLAAMVADRSLRRLVAGLPMRLVYADGRTFGAGDTGAPAMVVNRPDLLARRVGRHGLIGFGESYMAGEWESTDLVGVLTALTPALHDAASSRAGRLSPFAFGAQRRSARPTRAQSLRDLAAHYDDVSGDLFIEFLDETMTYAGALFDQLPACWDDLAHAQRTTIDRLLDAAAVGPGTRLLELGAGWGELSIRAAARGAEVHSVTPSERQAWVARKRVAAAGRSDGVRITVGDCHDVEGGYDALVSVGLIDAMGHHSWPDFLRAVGSLVEPGGRVVIQAIAQPHRQMIALRNRQTWTQKYVFPGAVLPSAKAVIGITQRATDLKLVDTLSLGEHQAETLRLWRERFLQRRKTLSHVGFDETFARMWELYLAGREAGLRSANLNVYQWTFVSGAAP